MNETQNKITLWTGDYITGETDLHELLGQSFVANGCTLLLCTEGRAVVTANGRKLAFRKGSLALLFSDVLFTPLYLSPSFSTTYLCLSEKLMEDVYYKLTSAVFWESVYAVPINRLSDEQYSLVQGWFAQMQWITVKAKRLYAPHSCAEACSTFSLSSTAYGNSTPCPCRNNSVRTGRGCCSVSSCHCCPSTATKGET